MAFGNFTGGHLQLPQLGCEINLQPRDILFVRSKLLWHKVSEVEDLGRPLFFLRIKAVLKRSRTFVSVLKRRRSNSYLAGHLLKAENKHLNQN